LNSKADSLAEWVLLDGNRLAVVAVVLAILAGVFTVVELLGWVPLESYQPLFYVFSGLIGGNLTLITVVVSINQLLLGRELETPGELESEMENVVQYREAVEDAAGKLAPVKPLGFLQLLFESTRQQAQRIGGMSYGAVDEEVREDVDDVLESLTAHLDRTIDQLQQSEPDTFEVLSTTLQTNYAEDIHRIRRLQTDRGDALPDSVMEAMEDLIDDLQRIDVARQYFKSVYLQEELSSLSRVLLYAGIPAEAAAVVALLSFTARSQTPLTATDHLFVPAAIVVSFLPLALLFAFILRTATVIERTAATIPFTTAQQEQ
jgi:hypothetical protein